MGLLKYLRSRETGILLAVLLVLLFMILGTARKAFLSPQNLQNLSRQIAFLGIFALGEAVVIIAGGIDLSVGSLIGLSGMLCALLLAEYHWPLAQVIVVVLLFSLFIGFLNSSLIGGIRLPAFVVTLGFLSILRSIAQLMNNANAIPIVGEGIPSGPLLFLANGRIGGIPTPMWAFLFFALLIGLMLARTPLGRYIYAIGANEEAARLSGIPVFWVKASAYCLCSFLSGLAGIFYTGYNYQGDPRSGTGYELNAIAAAVIGGCSLTGGQGSVLGVILGSCLLNLLVNGINLVIQRNASLWEGVIVGSVVITAALLNVVQQHPPHWFSYRKFRKR